MGIIAQLIAFFLSVIPTDKGERRHIHVYKTRTKNKSNCSAKIWIEKDGNKNFEIVYNDGLSNKEIKQICEFIDENYSEIIKQSDNVFNGSKVKIIKKLK